MAKCIWVALEAHLRPGEMLLCRKRDLFRPVGGRHGGSFWTLLLHPQDRFMASKTPVYDEGIVFDFPQHQNTGPVFEPLKQGGPDPPLLDMTYLEYYKEFNAASVEVGLGMYEMVPYVLRHAGPSADKASGVRSLKDI